MAVVDLTLPIESDSGLSMDAREARQAGDLLQDDFQKADPFPHIVIDNLLPAAVLKQALAGFPTRALASDGWFNIGYAGQHKRQIMPEDCNAAAREMFWFMNSRSMLQFLEGMSGIEGLIPDPYFMGGGYHETTRGGKLGIHADFRIHEQLNLQRRLNLLIYLNETWDDTWKGQLELWDRGMTHCAVRVSPIMNRCVVFRTDADTWHGHPDELEIPEHLTRRSIALYYYTASKGVYQDVPASSTVYRARHTDDRESRTQARNLRLWETVRDWVPPVVFRRLSALRWRLDQRKIRAAAAAETTAP
jgi:hypothetical protein